jgi:ketosteroid isomerase-like protein
VSGVIERYLAAIASHNWAVVDDCIADDIVRVGPYGDRYDGRDAYLAFISELMPTLGGYRMDIHRVTYANDSLGFAELTETIAAAGDPFRTPEVLVFALADERIVRVDIFIQTLKK